jgi:hypothetical protein
MAEILHAGVVARIAPLVATLTKPAGTFLLLEQQPRQVVQRDDQQELLHFGQFDTNVNLEGYTSGRIFCDNFELRWEPRDTGTYVVYTGAEHYKPQLAETSTPNLKTHTLDLSPYAIRSTSYYLFGKRLAEKQIERIGPPAMKGDFAEVRIPRLLRYPPATSGQQGAPHVRLIVCEYIDRDQDSIVAFRFKGLEGAE